MQPAERVLAKERARADAEGSAMRSPCPTASSLSRCSGVRLADGRPVIYSRDRIPEALRRSTPTPRRLAVRRARAGAATASCGRAPRLVPVVADERLAGLLEVEPGAPLLHIDQTDRDERGRAVMLSEEWHVADAFELIVNRRA